MFPLFPFFVTLLTAVTSPAASTNYFADNGFGKPIRNMQHPCAECYHGVAYIAYQGSGEDPDSAVMITRKRNGLQWGKESGLISSDGVRDARVASRHFPLGTFAARRHLPHFSSHPTQTTSHPSP